MAGIVPSHAVITITKLFPDAVNGESVGLTHHLMSYMKGVFSIVNKIPEELLVLNDDNYTDFIVALTELQIVSDWFIANAKPEPGKMQPAWNYGAGQNPIGRIVKALKQCPDEYPLPETEVILFVDDIALRDSIRSDAGAVDRALTNKEWKAATVFSGSAIEALLLWKVSKYPNSAMMAAIDDLDKLQKFADLGGRRPPNQLDRWNLGQLIVVAEKLGCITSLTARAAHLARDFRNLIHPAKSVRTGAASNRATAYSAAGALAHVVEDLSP
jgi:hypothetical protein